MPRSRQQAAMHRLPPQPGEWIDRQQVIAIEFEGRAVQGFAGDTLMTAMLASGETLLGRSFKYHRPRSVLSCAGHDINALMATGASTHLRADSVGPEAGQHYRAVNASPDLAHDRDRWLNLIAPLLPVGFYYKAFHTPSALFPFWERIIREKAGLGAVDTEWQTGRVPKRYHHCDVLVVGAGCSGLAAAIEAAERGAAVLLVDENPRPGGSLGWQWRGDSEAQAHLQHMLQACDQHAGITVMTGACAVGFYEDYWLPVATADGLVKVRAKSVVVASGSWEQPAVFRNNDLPGIMLASAALRLVHRFALAPCNTAVMLVANAAGYRAASALQAAGIHIAAIIDMRPGAETAWENIPVYSGAVVYEAHGRHDYLEAVTICSWDNGRVDIGKSRRIPCDGLLMSVGWAPAAPLLYQAGARFSYDSLLQQWVPGVLPEGVFACGSVNGVDDWRARVSDGKQAGSAAAACTMGDSPAYAPAQFRSGEALSHHYPIVAHPKGKNFVDFDEDVQLGDLLQACREGFDNIELLKRFTTVGMGPSQGKHANMNAIRILARATGRDIDATGSTTARPFYHPVPMKQLAGRSFRPLRLSPLQSEHQRLGAVMMEAGAWLRPEYYATGTDREAAIRAEAIAVRERVGVIDVSTLGKLEVFGSEAAILLDRFYTMRMDTLKIGMTRYALAVDDSGVVIDDGIVARLAEDLFYVTATTGHSAETARELNRCVIEWGLEATVVNVTGQRAAINLAGPLSRALLQPLVELDLGDEAFPYLGARTARVLGEWATLLRVGFVGELGYEIHLPWNQLPGIWQQLLERGQAMGIQPFGVEAQRRLRLEKGHVIVGQDTDGVSTPFDAGLAWAVNDKKPFFIGQRSLRIQRDTYRFQLLGVQLPEASDAAVPEECCLVIHRGEIAGRITSFAFSPTLNRYIGLAQVDRRLLPEPEVISVRTVNGALVELEVVVPPFYDRAGDRQRQALSEVA